MNILVYGAGVIGSVYAARLQEAGYNVSLLARGQRAVSLRTQGILLEDASTGHRTSTQVSLVDHLAPTDSYDVVIVTVRLDQLTSILPVLAANHQIPTILFLLNNPDGMQRLEMLEPHRVLLGFPSIGGSRQGEVVRYTHHPALARTTLGKEDGRVTPRLRQLATAFKKAGFSVALLGMAILATAGAYDMRTFRSSPEAPDATHSVMQESHGIRRFKTPEQKKLFVSLNIVGAVTFAVGATLLILHSHLNKRDAS